MSLDKKVCVKSLIVKFFQKKKKKQFLLLLQLLVFFFFFFFIPSSKIGKIEITLFKLKQKEIFQNFEAFSDLFKKAK